MKRTILLVDDEINLLSLLSDVFENEGFQIFTARNGQAALQIARQKRPDLIILDLMMSNMDGYEFLRLHQQEFGSPVIILSAKIEELDKLLGLKLGADDYVTKPFSPKELAARVQAVLRRTNYEHKGEAVVKVGEVILDHSMHTVTIAGDLVNLTPTEFDLLAILLTVPGRVFSRAELLEKLQESIVEGYERTVDVHIKNLRSKIEPNPKKPIYIETVYGIGYRFSHSSEM